MFDSLWLSQRTQSDMYYAGRYSCPGFAKVHERDSICKCLMWRLPLMTKPVLIGLLLEAHIMRVDMVSIR